MATPFLERSRSQEEAEDERAYEPNEQIRVSATDWQEPADVEAGLPPPLPPFSFRRLLRFLGPGFLMSIAYLDPGNLESDLQAGAQTGYSLLWVLLWSTLMGLLLQVTAARVGVVTGCHLAELCRMEYSRTASLALWVMAELAIIGADIQEVIGSAIAIQILSGGVVPLWLGVVITAFDSFFILFVEQCGMRSLEAVFGFFIAVMALAFARMAVAAQPSGVDIIKGVLIPSIPRGATSQAVSIVGAVIMPHNLFLHSALVQSRAIDRSRPSQIAEAVFYFTIESALTLLLSFGINLCVVAVFAHLFAGKPHAHSIGLSNAARYLQAAFGSSSFPVALIWSIGLLSAGQSSTMTGTYAGQFVMSGFLDLHVPKWLRVLITRSAAIIPTVAVALYFNAPSTQEPTLLPHHPFSSSLGLHPLNASLVTGVTTSLSRSLASSLPLPSSSSSISHLEWINATHLASSALQSLHVPLPSSHSLPSPLASPLPPLSLPSALDSLNEWLNVLQSVQLPFAVVPLLAIAASPRVMGPFALKGKRYVAAWATALLIIAVNFFLVINFAFDTLALTPVLLVLLTSACVAYVIFLIYLARGMRSESHEFDIVPLSPSPSPSLSYPTSCEASSVSPSPPSAGAATEERLQGSFNGDLKTPLLAPSHLLSIPSSSSS